MDIKIFNNHKFLNWVFFITLKNQKHFITFKKVFDNKGIQLNYFWKPIHMQKPYKKYIKTKMNNTNNIWNRVVILPSHPGVNRNQQIEIINAINKIL